MNRNQIRIAIVGVGNCACNLVQGIKYYKINKAKSTGLMHRVMGGFDISDIEIVAAFDIAEGKVGQDLSTAIFVSPNCTEKIIDIPPSGVIVQKGPVLDGWGPHFEGHIKISEMPECNIEYVLKTNRVDAIVVMLPTGSTKACYTYVEAALNLGIGVVNGIPVLISHDENIVKLAEMNHASIIGDDFKSQIGGTILHNTLCSLLKNRGVEISNSYQLNYAGNMDFLNLQTTRGNEKHKSKKRGVLAGCDELDLSIGVSYIENQNDIKTCRIWIEGENFASCPITLECKLTVVDSANSSGVIVDAIRCIAIAKKLKIYGRLEAPSAYYMKSPYKQIENSIALEEIEKLLETAKNEYSNC
ncbi:MAG: inositol-3-phosphate synthase [Bacteroidaceae bacterium]|nr:inositol-3-phosphate synthase [Bacteroidaceae bacterium]